METVDLRCAGRLTVSIDFDIGEVHIVGDGRMSAQQLEQAIVELTRAKDALETGVG